MKVILGSKAGKLGQEVVSMLNLQRVNTQIDRFPDGESNVIVSSADLKPGSKVLVIQSLCSDGDIMEFLLIVDALNRMGILDIVLISPYFAYTRADRIVTPGSAISAKVVAKLIGDRVSSVVLLDVHFPQFEGFFEVPVRNILPWSVFRDNASSGSDFALVAPDMGAVKKLKSLSEEVEMSFIIMNKCRTKACLSEVTEVIGEISGKNCIIVDDIVCGGGTLCNSAAKLKEFGAKSVSAFITHGVLSGVARQRIADSCIDEVIITNSIPGRKSEGKIRVVSVAAVIAKEIRSVYLDVNTKSPYC